MSEHILICGLNWLGDGCMSMPALQAFRASHPSAHIAMLVKPPLAPLWRCSNAVDEVLTLLPGHSGPFRTGISLRATPFTKAYIFPNSWRAALPPFVARIPARIGFRGHMRRILLTTVIPEPQEDVHQQWEYAAILQLPPDTPSLPPPELTLPPPPADCPRRTPAMPLFAILPGAARGPAKRWPETHFVAAAHILYQNQPCQFLVMGTPAESPLCQAVADALPGNAVCLAGKTALPEFAAALQACDGVLCNDSGGMHLAAAVGTPVVAMFGLTNPAQTGPIGDRVTCLQPEGIQGTRRIPRSSTKAQEVLAAIPPERAVRALLQLVSVPAAPSS